MNYKYAQSYSSSPASANRNSADGHAAHGGNLRSLAETAGCTRDQLLDASANLNPLGPPDWLDAALYEGRKAISEYPDPQALRLRGLAATALGLDAAALVFGNGADELMFALGRSLAEKTLPGAGSVHYICEPCYASYREAAASAGFPVQSIQLDKLESTLAAAPAGSAVWLGAPNNPDGQFPTHYPQGIADLAAKHPDVFFVLDEAFIDFCADETPGSALPLQHTHDTIIIIRSLTKFWCVPGLRIGYVCWPAGATALRAQIPNWPLNCLAEAFACRVFEELAAQNAEPQTASKLTGQTYSGRTPPGRSSKQSSVLALRRTATLQLLQAERDWLAAEYAKLPGLKFIPGQANFYLLHYDPALYGELHEQLLQHAIAVRCCDNFSGLAGNHVRIAIRTHQENITIIEALHAIAEKPETNNLDSVCCAVSQQPGTPTSFLSTAYLTGSPLQPALQSRRRAKALMIQGCSSDAGKSLVTAALCRIFRNKGYDVAPFKAQNMSLNSAVTADGLELGRAQAVQAAACGLPPEARMNPVLLKPESDSGSQVVLMGKPYASYQAKRYYELHETMKATARAAYDSLAADHQLILMEGAGSPAEINLKSRDFVNMGAALHAGARVLLVGDIDRGGVFASFIGTVSTFSPAELKLFAGFLVNKFRGDPDLLGDAFAMTRERSGFPVLGCIPMLSGLNIPDEDQPLIKAGSNPDADMRIVVPKLRRVSNFTDLDAFAADPDVAVIAVDNPAQFRAARPDIVIIPGSKATVADLHWLCETGLAEAIQAFAKSGGTVIGICGGYQMLGSLILDRQHTESSESRSEGLGLLPLITEFHPDKTLVQTEAVWLQGGYKLNGYEIHHGRTRLVSDNTAADGKGSSPDSAAGIATTAAASTPAASTANTGIAYPVMKTADGEIIGYAQACCWGSYLHGLFDNDEFRRYILNKARELKGLQALPVFHHADLDAELDRLAAAVEQNIDFAAIESLVR